MRAVLDRTLIKLGGLLALGFGEDPQCLQLECCGFYALDMASRVIRVSMWLLGRGCTVDREESMCSAQRVSRCLCGHVFDKR